MSNDQKTTPIDIAGNIFVDQGALTLKVLLGKTVKEALVVQDIFDLKVSTKESGFDWLANNIDRFKSYAMIFTTNHPRFNSAIKDRLVRITIFKEFLNSLVDGVIDEYDPGIEKSYTCDICGHPHNFDFDAKFRVISSVYAPSVKGTGKKQKTEPKFSCREFFPLVGTMGSESQAFSNMSRCFIICPRCLLFVYYLPFSNQIIEGNMAIFQISDPFMQYKMVKIIVDKYLDKIRTGAADSEIQNVGKEFKSKNELIFENFLALFRNLLPESPMKVDFSRNFPSNRLSCWLWKYVNSGQKASFSYEIIPNNAVNFLYLTSCFDLTAPLLDIVHQELKDIKYPPKQIFNAIRRKELYQFEKLDTNEITLDRRLVLLYYYYILDYPRDAIRAAVQVASKLPEYDRNVQDKKTRARIPILINQICRELMGSGQLAIDMYQFIFSLLPKSPRSKLAQSIISQIWMLGFSNDDLNVFEQQLLDMLQDDVLADYTKLCTMRLTNLEWMVLGSVKCLFTYFKGNGMKDNDIRDKIIDKQLKKATISWFSTIFAQALLLTKEPIDVIEYFFLIDSIGSWTVVRSLFRTLFASFISPAGASDVTSEEKISIPLEFRFKFQNLIIERVFGDYLDYRITRQGKGISYVKRTFVDSVIKGRTKASMIYNLLYDHAQDNELVGEKDKIQYKLTDWIEMTLSPETGLQDISYFMQYAKIFLASYVASYYARMSSSAEESTDTLSIKAESESEEDLESDFNLLVDIGEEDDDESEGEEKIEAPEEIIEEYDEDNESESVEE